MHGCANGYFHIQWDVDLVLLCFGVHRSMTLAQYYFLKIGLVK